MPAWAELSRAERAAIAMLFFVAAVAIPLQVLGIDAERVTEVVATISGIGALVIAIFTLGTGRRGRRS